MGTKQGCSVSAPERFLTRTTGACGFLRGRLSILAQATRNTGFAGSQPARPTFRRACHNFGNGRESGWIGSDLPRSLWSRLEGCCTCKSGCEGSCGRSIFTGEHPIDTGTADPETTSDLRSTKPLFGEFTDLRRINGRGRALYTP